MRILTIIQISTLGVLFMGNGCASSSGGSSGTATTASTSTVFAISPQDATVAPDGTIQFEATGGSGSYSFSIVSSGSSSLVGTMTALGYYTAPASSVSITVEVVDLETEASITTSVTVSTTAGGTVPSSIVPLTVSPGSEFVSPGQVISLVVSGGSGNYSYYLFGAGTLAGNIFTAPTAADSTSEILVYDTTYQYGTNVIFTTPAGSSDLSLAPANPVVGLSGYIQFETSGGSGSYTYTILTEGTSATVGTITNAGYYTAPPTATTVQIQVEDNSTSETAVTTVTIED